MSSIVLPYDTGSFSCIEADPPWSEEQDFGWRGRRGVREYQIAPKYDEMSVNAIKAMGGEVSRIAKPSCHLWMWFTDKYVIEGFCSEIVRSWGFEPKKMFVWVYTNRKGEPTYKLGHWGRTGSEYLLLATNDKSFRPQQATTLSTVFFGVKQGPHSHKPDEAYAMISRNSPGPRLSMFQRSPREGFECWGNQMKGDANG